MRRLLSLFSLLTAIIFGVVSAFAQDVADSVSPEFGSIRQSSELVRTKEHMVVAAHPEASKAGHAILEQGGNAIDAMIAVQLVLGLVEPQSSGIGGGAFLVYHDASSNKLITLDGRETAPLAATGDMFIGVDGEPMQFFDAVIGGKSVGTPGTVALLEKAHQLYGKLDWAELFGPAIKLAEEGFIVSDRMNASVEGSAASLFLNETTRQYFLSEEGVPLFPGTKIINKPYADTLKAIARYGKKSFYSGQIAENIVNVIQSHEENPGTLSLEDLSAYEVKERPPVCFEYHNHKICGMGPPSSGTLTVGQILKIIEPFDMASLGPANPDSWRMIGDASRLAFADRGRYMADTDFIKMPKGLLNEFYLEERSGLIEGDRIDSGKALPTQAIQPGTPPSDHTFLFSDDQSLELPSTSHFTIVDKDRNVVSMTTTIENGFGSRLMVDGFLLNNEMTDFSFVPELGGKQIANRIEPGKRPRSSMAPLIVYKDDKPWLAIGSPGGSRIINYVAKTLIAMIDWKMDAHTAIALPHLINRFGAYDLEEETSAEDFAPALVEMGYRVNSRNLNSGLHTITITDEGLAGGVDPRREGLAIGK